MSGQRSGQAIPNPYGVTQVTRELADDREHGQRVVPRRPEATRVAPNGDAYAPATSSDYGQRRSDARLSGQERATLETDEHTPYDASFGRLSDIVDEAFGMQPVMSDAELLTLLEQKLAEQRRAAATPVNAGRIPLDLQLVAMLGRMVEAHDGSHSESCDAFGHGSDAEQEEQAEEGPDRDYCDCGGMKLRNEARALLGRAAAKTGGSDG